LRLEDMAALDFARKAREAGVTIPIILLTYDAGALNELTFKYDTSVFDRVFIWQGDFRILLAIIKSVEDRANLDHDTKLVGVQSIILIEDNVRFYSAYLPIIYTELMRHTQSLISEGVNPAHRMLRRRARSKILLCTTYEEAWSYFEKYHDNVLGVISDLEFPMGGVKDPQAGVAFIEAVRSWHKDIPILLQSDDPGAKAVAEEHSASFLMKNSPTLLNDLRRFMKENFSFGDFVFRLPDGSEVGRATDLRTLEEQLQVVPGESLGYHGERNHFSNWLKARTEFLHAYKLRPHKVSDYRSIEDIRRYLIGCIRDLRTAQQQGNIVDFDPQTFDPNGSFARIGGGSLGGKGRGLAFVNSIIYTYLLQNRFEGVRISVPPTVVIGSDVFDQFLNDNRLWDVALKSSEEKKIESAFLRAEFPRETAEALRAYLKMAEYPLTVRSSSLLEDSRYQPFAGIYRSFMIPNNHTDLEARLAELVSAVKRVYASTFSHCAKSYIRATPYRVEEEKMAVIVQKLVGSRHGDRFYPDFSGVANSHNYYPTGPMKSADGIASVALGLGHTVMEGGRALKFSPKYPQHPVQFSAVEDMLRNSQKNFYALELPDPNTPRDPEREPRLLTLGLADAEADGTLDTLASTYSHENHQVYDGVGRVGARLVSFAPILKQGAFPLADMLRLMLRVGTRGMSSSVEIEFAARASVPKDETREFCILQMRPMVVSHEGGELSIEETDEARMICHSTQVLGDGVLTDLRDVVYVDIDRFERAASKEVAEEIGRFNDKLASSNVPYVLIGVGRWGSSDPWLGIPVSWDQISGARVMVETSFKDFRVTPSQGTHFFQNLISFRIGYFTVNSDLRSEFLNWEWLRNQRSVRDGKYSRHLRFDAPLTVKMNGRANRGVILKPGGV
ncbi:MAG: Phosphoenolpyruvate synthase, partial [Candidatus Krumholzibacteriota bacterium]|nr:Phosphoenolpyruvate synthase [Candidatus Krumholzibacteriota bacterium]